MKAIGKSDTTPRRPAPVLESERARSGIEVRHLRALVALVDNGTMTAAAQALGVSQSTVSEAIAGLERALGTAAVSRRSGSRVLALTPGGRALLPHARSVLAVLGEAHTAVAAATRAVRATVEVIANESLSTYLLPRALTALRRRWPNTRFAVSVGTCEAVREGVAGGRFDLGLSFETARASSTDDGASDSPGGRGVALAEVTLVLFCGQGHPLVASPARELLRQQLAPYTVFSSDASGDFHVFLRRYFGRAEGPGPRLEFAGSVEAVKRNVETDARALGVLPAYAVADEIKMGSLRVLPVRPSLPRVGLEAIVCTTRPENPAAAELVENLRTLLQSPEVQIRAQRNRPA